LVRYLSAKSVEVEALPVVEVQIDGDVHGHAPARMRVRPGALRVVTPPPTGGT
jgi:diacylglycerol kinase family enzyme